MNIMEDTNKIYKKECDDTKNTIPFGSQKIITSPMNIQKNRKNISDLAI